MRIPFIALLATACLLAGCATQSVRIPPISTESVQRQNPGQIIWHDLATRDPEIAQAFYGQLFGWSFEKIGKGPRQYTLIKHRGDTIGGMFKFETGEKESAHGEWLLNLSTENVDAAAAAFAEAGGRVVEPPRDYPDRGRGAFVQDAQGALMILLASSSGDPEGGDVPYGGWLWQELWTNDAPAALDHYQNVFGYETADVDGPPGRDYTLLTKNGEPVAGILSIDTDEVRPHWLPFIRVQSVANTVATARAMQANVILDADPDVREGKVALLQGPTGEPFVVQEYDFN